VAAYGKARGAPLTGIRAVARRFGVSEKTVIKKLHTAWGEARFNQRVPLSGATVHHRPAGEKYAQAYDAMRGPALSRLKQIATRFGVQELTVRGTLRTYWGVRKYEQEFGSKGVPFPVDRNELLAMARKLGIPESSLKNKMNRWGVIRGPYVVDE